MEFKFGGTRFVFLIGKYAFKIAHPPIFWRRFLYGCLSNIEERYQWKKQKIIYNDNVLTENLAELYNPTLFCSWFGLIAIQPRLKLSNVEQLSDHEHYLEHNVGTDKNGKQICLDYGVKPLSLNRNKSKIKKLLVKIDLM